MAETNKTVVVVGAGASCEFGFPSGTQLNGLIAERLATRRDDWGDIRWTDDVINEAFRSWSDLSPNALYEATKTIREGIHFHQSPDDYLYAMGADPAVVGAGKAGIAAAILVAERSSWLAKLHEGDAEVASQHLISNKNSRNLLS